MNRFVRFVNWLVRRPGWCYVHCVTFVLKYIFMIVLTKNITHLFKIDFVILEHNFIKMFRFNQIIHYLKSCNCRKAPWNKKYKKHIQLFNWLALSVRQQTWQMLKGDSEMSKPNNFLWIHLRSCWWWIPVSCPWACQPWSFFGTVSLIKKPSRETGSFSHLAYWAETFYFDHHILLLKWRT